MSAPGAADRLRRAAGRVPQRWRRAVPERARNAIVARFGHPEEPFDPAAHPRKLNLGAGYDNRPGYLNVDAQAFHSPDLVGDVRALPELPSGFYDEIVAQDVLEHLVRADVPVALVEWRRLLAPGGRLWLRVPDLPALLRWLDASDDPDRQRQILHLLFGTQAYEGDYHHAGFTDVLLPDELHRAGFARVDLERRDEWLWEGEAFAADADEAGGAVALAWTAGFHRREQGDDGSSWRWAEPEAELALYAARAGDAVLELEVLRGEASLTGAGADEALAPGEHRIPLALPAGATRLRFSAHSGFDDETGRERALALQLGATSVAAP